MQFFAPKNGYLTKPIIILTSQRLGSFYPFSIPSKTQPQSKFEPKSKHCFRKKDNFKDKKRIKRIIFLELGEVSKIQTTPKLSLHSLFQIYPSGYSEKDSKKF